jgi:acyl-coenzyme A synthetase/AMP-(fatty) acid ligase
MVEILDKSGAPVSPGQVGEVAIRRPDPVMFLEYCGNPQATEEKYVGDWCLTGDLARRDEAGYLWFVGRKDDVITSAGVTALVRQRPKTACSNIPRSVWPRWWEVQMSCAPR